MTKATINIGVVGAGAIVRDRHMPGFAALDDVRVLAVCNRTRASAERFAADYDVPRIADDYHEILAMDDIDAVLIGAYPYMHHPVTMDALSAGKHVFTQARMCMNHAEAVEMLQASREHPELVTAICPSPLGMTGGPVLCELLEGGFVGQVHMVRMSHLADTFIDPRAPLHWRQDDRVSGRNVLTLGIMVETIHRWLGLHSTVNASFRIFHQTRHDPHTDKPYTVQIPDSVTVEGTMVNGAQYSYTLSGVVRHGPNLGVEIYGQDGTIEYDMATDQISVGTIDQDQPTPPAQAEGGQEMSAKVDNRQQSLSAEKRSHRLQPVTLPPGRKKQWTVEKDFIQAIRDGGGSPDTTFADGVAYMEFVEACWKSAAVGSVVTLPLEDDSSSGA